MVPFLVGQNEKRLNALRNNPAGATFTDFCACLINSGFVLERTSGSHRIYRHGGPRAATLSVQPRKDGKAKPYQIRQFLTMLDDILLRRNS